jgi:hypothetical protein
MTYEATMMAAVKISHLIRIPFILAFSLFHILTVPENQRSL